MSLVSRIGSVACCRGWVSRWWVVAAVLALSAPLSVAGQALFRISLENSADHVQVRAVQRFADSLAERTEGRLAVELYSDARLFRDRDVVAALIQGKVEMALPGTWQLDRFEPAVGVLLLPGFYGRDREFIYRHMEGQLGREIDSRLAQSTGTVVLGRWIDLGPIHLFSVDDPITRHEDISGLRIRYAGGIVNQMRLAALGADPLLIPWPEFRQRLLQREADGVLTSFESVASARLWEAGIRFAFEDSQYYGHYVPLVSPQYWRRLAPELRQIIQQTWEEHVDQAREDAARAQAEARARLQLQGVQIAVPPQDQLQLWRSILYAQQPTMIEQLGIDPALVPMIPYLR